MKQQSGYMELISKPEVSFWVPILITVISWAASFGVLYSKVDTIIKYQDMQYQMWLQLEKRVGNLEVQQSASTQFHEEVKNLLKIK